MLWGQETIVKYKGMINSALGHKNCWSKTFPHGKPRFQSSLYGQPAKCFSIQCGKTRAKSVVFSFICEKIIMFCIEIFHSKSLFAHFFTDLTRVKRPQIKLTSLSTKFQCRK